MRVLSSVFVWVMWAAGSNPAAGAARVSPGDWAGGLAEYGYSPEATMAQPDSYTLAYLNFSYTDEKGVNHTSSPSEVMYTIIIFLKLKNSMIPLQSFAVSQCTSQWTVRAQIADC